MRTTIFLALVVGFSSTANAAPADEKPAAPPPTLEWVFSLRATLAPPVELGTLDDGRRRFIAITGGEVYGPRLKGSVMPGGGDWQTIQPEGMTKVEARYFLKAADGTVIEVHNPGVRTADPGTIEALAKGEKVDPSAYYFRTSPVFRVAGNALAWMQRHTFVARGIRHPDSVIIDYYMVR